ncbi:MAG: hypothetical protein WKF82_01090 [Nocardioidaceae bacterium]
MPWREAASAVIRHTELRLWPESSPTVSSGVIICFTYIAVWEQNPDAGGYDVTDALTYVWLGQAMIMTVAVWAGGATDDLAGRIKDRRRRHWTCIGR